MWWLQIAIKPGKPFAFGNVKPSMTPVFALPGNPVAALVSFELIVHPALRKLGGHRLLHQLVLSATAASPIHRKRDGKLHAIRAIAVADGDGHLFVHPVGHQGSHLLRAMADANALVLLPDGEGVEAGTPVKVVLPAIDRVERLDQFSPQADADIGQTLSGAGPCVAW
jgi:molybdopterin biosynthesis enzyme